VKHVVESAEHYFKAAGTYEFIDAVRAAIRSVESKYPGIHYNDGETGVQNVLDAIHGAWSRGLDDGARDAITLVRERVDDETREGKLQPFNQEFERVLDVYSRKVFTLGREEGYDEGVLDEHLTVTDKLYYLKDILEERPRTGNQPPRSGFTAIRNELLRVLHLLLT